MKKGEKMSIGTVILNWKRNRLGVWAREVWKQRNLIFFSLILLSLALIFDYHSGQFVANLENAVVVPDAIIDNFGPYDLGILFIEFYFIITTVYFAYPVFFNVRKLPRAIAHFSLLVLVRSFMIVFTHLKTPETGIPVHFPFVFNSLVFQNDMFFSGHTAAPFLGFLLFKESKIRYFFLASSIVMGITSLLAHRHYSIDVFSAFFIAYGTFVVGERIFNKIKTKINR